MAGYAEARVQQTGDQGPRDQTLPARTFPHSDVLERLEADDITKARQKAAEHRIEAAIAKRASERQWFKETDVNLRSHIAPFSQVAAHSLGVARRQKEQPSRLQQLSDV